ncbi:MAG: succinate dehydrogenase/fumarate reductase iron-sulfur subunit, partial [Pseudomonadota bacterium]
MGTEHLEVSVWRGTDTGAFEIFDVPLYEHQTVLDVV